MIGKTYFAALRRPAGWPMKMAKAVLVIAVLCTLAWGVLQALEGLGGAPGLRARFGDAAMLFLLPLFAVPPIPGELAGVVTVSLYGFTLGAPMVWCGLLFRAGVEYALANRLRGGSTQEVAETGRLPHWIARFPARHPVFLVAGRWMPFGNHIVSVAAGLRGVPLWRFAWTSALGLVPFTLIIAAGTAGLVAAHG
jgi:uncharacterized membrane protein YdjX (TVP38/TMEM64 family)